MKVSQIIGADLSKRTIDFFCHCNQQHQVFENSVAGFKELIRWLRQLKIDGSEVMIVMEHTGMYSYLFEEFLHSRQIAFAKVPALQIIRSMGMVRGKSDKIDARRIADYGAQHLGKLPVAVPTTQQLKQLRRLHCTRDRLVKIKASVSCAVKELKNIGLKDSDAAMRSQLKVINCLKEQIATLEEKIKSVLLEDPELSKTHTLLKSIKGVGDVLATATIITTNNFTRFANARKFACFSGTAPFQHQSGTSIRRRTRVSHLADKSMKTLLDLSAKSAIVYDPEIREFYRKRTSEGKPKMSTINIVRNKIIYRMFAVVKRGTPFQLRVA
jgi:transposase